jgi:hypothetical protein
MDIRRQAGEPTSKQAVCNRAGRSSSLLWRDNEFAGKIVETAQRRWLCDVQIITDENPCPPSASQKVTKVCDDHTSTAVEQESDRDVTGRVSIEVSQ